MQWQQQLVFRGFRGQSQRQFGNFRRLITISIQSCPVNLSMSRHTIEIIVEENLQVTANGSWTRHSKSTGGEQSTCSQRSRQREHLGDILVLRRQKMKEEEDIQLF